VIAIQAKGTEGPRAEQPNKGAAPRVVHPALTLIEQRARWRRSDLTQLGDLLVKTVEDLE
jgi:hypothetical protein